MSKIETEPAAEVAKSRVHSGVVPIWQRFSQAGLLLLWVFLCLCFGPGTGVCTLAGVQDIRSYEAIDILMIVPALFLKQDLHEPTTRQYALLKPGRVDHRYAVLLLSRVLGEAVSARAHPSDDPVHEVRTNPIVQGLRVGFVPQLRITALCGKHEDPIWPQRACDR